MCATRLAARHRNKSARETGCVGGGIRPHRREDPGPLEVAEELAILILE